MWSFEPRKGLAICRAKVVPSLLSYFKTLDIGLALGRTHNLPLHSQVLYWLSSSYRRMYNQSMINKQSF